MARQLLLETAGIGKVVEQDQLTRFAVQRAGGDGQASPVAQGNLVTVILARSEAAGDHLTPEHAHQRLAKQAQGRRVGLADHAMGIDDDDAAGKQVEQALQAVRQALLSASSSMRCALTRASCPFSSVTRSSSRL